MALAYKKCPICGSKNVINIVYGMPSYELLQESEQGKVKLGGCEIVEGCPEYICKDCNHEWNKQQIFDDAYEKIVRFKASVGGFFGPSYEVDLDFKNMQFIWNGREDEAQDIITKTINEYDCKSIIEQLKSINLLDWKSKYLEPDICDGTQWSVDIEAGGKIIHKYGSNRYPKEWKNFCRIIKAITGRNFS